MKHHNLFIIKVASTVRVSLGKTGNNENIVQRTPPLIQMNKGVAAPLVVDRLKTEDFYSVA